jgi:hypothetical protein
MVLMVSVPKAGSVLCPMEWVLMVPKGHKLVESPANT